jgi:hypothetical protein
MEGINGKVVVFLHPAQTVSNNWSHALEVPGNQGFGCGFPGVFSR